MRETPVILAMAVLETPSSARSGRAGRWTGRIENRLNPAARHRPQPQGPARPIHGGLDAGIKSEHADAIVDAVRQAAAAGDHVTPDQFTRGLAELEARLTWRFAGALLAQTAAMAAIMATLLRLFASS